MNKGCGICLIQLQNLLLIMLQKKRASMNNTLSAHLGLHSVEESDESIIYLIYSKDGVEN